MDMRLRTLLFAMVAFALCGCSKAEAENKSVSALPQIATLRSVIACIADRVENSPEKEVWSGGAPTGPAQSGETLKACAPNIDFSALSDRTRVDANFVQASALFPILLGFGDKRDHFTVEDFDYAINRASCIENMANRDPAFFSRDAKESRPVWERAMIACIPRFLEMAASSDYNPPRRDFIAFTIANLNLNFIRAKMVSND
jgi:hypothetical protein